MDWVSVSQLKERIGQEVELRGWLDGKRSSGKLHFLQVRDGSGVVQCVMFRGDVDEATFQRADHLAHESSVVVHGSVKADARSPIGVEVSAKGFEVVHESEEYPITPKEHGVAFLMEHRHLWLRSSRQRAILRVRAEIIAAVRSFFDDRGFVLVDAPIFTPAACEGTTTLFETDYFGEKAYLTQSGQLYMEAAAMALGKVYCFGPTFRAEKSKTRRHLTEFWMVEPEVAYFTLTEDMVLAEEFLEYVVSRVLERRRPELALLERNTAALEKVKAPFPRLSHREAVALLLEKGVPADENDDFGAEQETVLAQSFEKPVIVHRYPAVCKAFYMKKDPADPSRALCMDVLAPEGYGEVIGGGQREDSLEALESEIRRHALPMEAFKWYLDLRRYGSVPHAGFGLGIERTVAWICGLPHVRETIPFPRMLEKITP
ncbi:MAG: asparagine--tRNA ligase [Deltaproteobacteria bacterium]|nr:asparagine--tRNA ligase [Deltaproteobacteria bacterium]